MTMFSDIGYKDSPSLDSFGRVRTSEPGNRFDCEFTYDLSPDLIESVTAGIGATTTQNANTRDVTLAVNNTTTGTSYILYSKYDIPYTPGNSQLVDLTGVLNLANLANGTTSIFLRSKISGSVVDLVEKTQSQWTALTSGMNWQYSQIFQLDFQSLKVGRIRFNIIQGGIPINVYEVTNDNIRNSGYWQRPTLPIFWRVYNDATYSYTEIGYGSENNAIGFRFKVAKNASHTAKAICSTVKSEGGQEILSMPGFNRAIDMGTTAKTVSNTLIPLLSIRPKATINSLDNRGVYIPQGITVQTDNPILVRIFNMNQSLTGASWTSVEGTYSGMEYDISASAITPGVQIFSSYIGGTNSGRYTVGNNILGKTALSLGRSGTIDMLSVCAIRTTNANASVLIGIDWKEIR